MPTNIELSDVTATMRIQSTACQTWEVKRVVFVITNWNPSLWITIIIPRSKLVARKRLGGGVNAEFGLWSIQKEPRYWEI